jgi:hypothetical protein
MTQKPKTSQHDPNQDDNLIGVRTALILVIATCIAVGVGVLSHIAGAAIEASILTAGAAWAGAIALLHEVLIRHN